jgi:hypothetical protein
MAFIVQEFLILFAALHMCARKKFKRGDILPPLSRALLRISLN